MSTRRRYATYELRRLADECKLPLPWPEQRRDDLHAALHYCADLLDAADKVVRESQYKPKKGQP